MLVDVTEIPCDGSPTPSSPSRPCPSPSPSPSPCLREELTSSNVERSLAGYAHVSRSSWETDCERGCSSPASMASTRSESSLARREVKCDVIRQVNSNGEEEEVRRYIVNIFLPSERFTRLTYLNRWRSIEEQCRFSMHLGKLISGDEIEIIDKLDRAHMSGTAVRSLDDKIMLYFTGRLSSNQLILMELIIHREGQVENADGVCNYKIEGHEVRSFAFEAFLRELLSQTCEGGDLIDPCEAERMKNFFSASPSPCSRLDVITEAADEMNVPEL